MQACTWGDMQRGDLLSKHQDTLLPTAYMRGSYKAEGAGVGKEVEKLLALVPSWPLLEVVS